MYIFAKLMPDCHRCDFIPHAEFIYMIPAFISGAGLVLHI